VHRPLLVLAPLLALAPSAPPAAPPTAPLAADAAAIFSEVGAAVGLDFVHFNGMSGDFYFPEVMGPGGALFDYDNDGDLDLYVVQGAMLGTGKTLQDAWFPPQGLNLPPRGRLFRNDLVVHPDGTRTLHFTDVTAASRIDARGYGMGVATGDFDGDGWTDLYLTNYGPNQLLHNNGDGTFTDVTAKSGTGDPRWSVSATFFDYDRDGRLDLYVANYVDAPLSNNLRCTAASSRRDWCGPASFPPLAGRLYHNQGNGTFEDVSARAGIAQHPEPSLGVVAFDADGDGWPDLYVANDGRPHQLWINRHDGTFRDDALLAGVALNRQGKAEAGMGVDAGDFDDDGDDDLVKTNLSGETNSLYVNDGHGTFEDRSLESGLAAGSLPFTSFGVGWIDADNDGRLDVLAVSGAVRILEPLAAKGDRFPLAQTKRLYRNLGGGRFEDATARAGPFFQVAEVSRGAAFGDVDNDGDTDVVVFNDNGPVRLLRNEVGSQKDWLGLRLVDGKGYSALGARVELVRSGARSLWRHVHSDGSYASASDPRLLFGLEESSQVTGLRVQWPDGRRETFPAPPLRRYSTLKEGTGSAVATP
jgi:hypothetical protein